MTLCELRDELLAEHGELRQKMAQLTALIDGPPRPSELRRVAGAFLEKLMLHNGREDQLLGPALEDADAWGPQRVQKMHEAHEHQTQALMHLARALEIADGDIAGELVRTLIAHVQADMAFEERDLLSAEVLRDDIITINQDDG